MPTTTWATGTTLANSNINGWIVAAIIIAISIYIFVAIIIISSAYDNGSDSFHFRRASHDGYFLTVFDYFYVGLCNFIDWARQHWWNLLRGLIPDGYLLGLFSPLIIAYLILATIVYISVILILATSVILGGIWAIVFEAGGDYINRNLHE